MYKYAKMEKVEVKKFIENHLEELFPSIKNMINGIKNEADKTRSAIKELTEKSIKQEVGTEYIKKSMDKGFEGIEKMLQTNNDRCIVCSSDVKEKFKNHDNRISSIEKWRNEFTGGYKLASIFGIKNIVIAILVIGLLAIGIIKIK